VSVGSIHGSTDPREVARLEKQADFVSRFAFPFFDATPGQRVLDLACGVGAMTARLKRAFPGIELIGVDLSKQQLAACRANHPHLGVVCANGESIPFADATFDRVHCSWLLEHVRRPQAIVTEVRRVLKPEGVCQFIEVENSSFSTRPELPAVNELLALLNAAQVRGGGDPEIGPKLAALFTAAGFSRFTLQPVQLVATHADPSFLSAFIDEFVEIFESLDESLGAPATGLIERATSHLRGLIDTPGAELRYSPWVGRGVR
jgi:ubiquinone/menaquinone biosynthesis C-methylase UbiE